MTGGFHLDLDLDMVTCFWFVHIQNLAVYLYSEGAKNIHVLKVLIWGFRGYWMIMTGVLHLDLVQRTSLS